MRFGLFALFAFGSALGAAAQDGINFVEPQGGFGGSVGGTCNVQWSRDTTGNWNNVQFDLMTGPDHLRRAIARVGNNIDATKDDSFSYTCPDVDTSGEIYFLRMTRLDTYDGEESRRYSGRFCINQNGGSCAQPAQGWGRGYISGTPLSLYHQSTNSPWNNINN